MWPLAVRCCCSRGATAWASSVLKRVRLRSQGNLGEPVASMPYHWASNSSIS